MMSSPVQLQPASGAMHEETPAAFSPTRENEDRNTRTIRDMYAAFARRDLRDVVSYLDEDVQWNAWPLGYESTTQKMKYPLAVKKTGRKEVLALLQELCKNKFTLFEVVDIVAGGNTVYVRCLKDMTCPRGSRFIGDEMHRWEFNDAGKIVLYRAYIDTAAAIEAYQSKVKEWAPTPDDDEEE